MARWIPTGWESGKKNKQGQGGFRWRDKWSQERVVSVDMQDVVCRDCVVVGRLCRSSLNTFEEKRKKTTQDRRNKQIKGRTGRVVENRWGWWFQHPPTRVGFCPLLVPYPIGLLRASPKRETDRVCARVPDPFLGVRECVVSRPAVCVCVCHVACKSWNRLVLSPGR